MSQKLSDTLSNLPIITPKAEVVDLSSPIHNPVELEQQSVPEQFRSVPYMVDMPDVNKYVNNSVNMLTPLEKDYTAQKEKPKKEDLDFISVRIPKALSKRIKIMLHQKNVIEDQSITIQDIYTRAIALYLKQEGFLE